MLYRCLAEVLEAVGLLDAGAAALKDRLRAFGVGLRVVESSNRVEQHAFAKQCGGIGVSLTRGDANGGAAQAME